MLPKFIKLMLFCSLLLAAMLSSLPSAPAHAQAFSCSNVSEIPTSECNDLVLLYNSTNGSGWTNKTGWLNTNTPCSWYGITCEAGHVSQIQLFSNQLSGNIPNFSNLPNLTHFYLYDNQLSGVIPNFSNLPNLQWLWLSSNSLSGNIPNFSNLPNLTRLYLYGNQLSGVIPNFSNLPNLQYLTLGSNQLNGLIPDFSNLPNLEYLYLNNNQLSGSIPNFSNLPNLRWLWLGSNQLNGVIPNLNWANIWYADFSNNCGLVAYDAAQAAILDEKYPSWRLCQLTGVTINGPAAGLANTPYTYTAAVSPMTTTLPITYTWTPAPVSGQGTANVSYNFAQYGIQTITVTASNSAGSVTATRQITVASPSCAAPTNGLVACYTFDGNANDGSGNSNHGIVSGAILSPDRFNKPNSAYSFRGDGGKIRLPLDYTKFSADLTIAVWAKFNNFDVDYPAIMQGENYFVVLHGLGPGYGSKQSNVGFYQENCTPENCTIEHPLYTRFGSVGSSEKLIPGSWYWLVVTRDGLTTTLYIDGTLVDQVTDLQLHQLSGSYLDLGVNERTPIASYLDGSLDEVRIYNRALSASEIQQLYQPASQAFTLTAISPNSAVANAGNVPVTISGLNFESPLTITLGHVTLLTPTLESSTTLRAVVPVGSLAQGNYTLTVSSAGQAVSLTNAFTVTAPIVETQVRVMVYLACDNDLADDCRRIIEQAELAMAEQPDLRIVMLYDGPEANDSAYLNIHPSKVISPFILNRYLAYTDTVKLPEVNTASPYTLIEFANWAASQYPGRYKLLSLVGHGAGWAPQLYLGQRRPHGAPGSLIDNHSPESDLSTVDLATALKAMTMAAPLDIVYLDNCLMSGVEVLSELSPYSHYLMAHENLTWSLYPYQAYFAGITAQTQPLDLANHMATVYKSNLKTDYPAQISVIDNRQVAHLEAKLDLLAQHLIGLTLTHRGVMSQAALNSMHVDETGDYRINAADSFIDLYEFAQQLTQPALPVTVQAAAREVQTAVKAAVVTNLSLNGYPYPTREFWPLDRLHGVSIYFPSQDQCERPFYNANSLPRFATNSHWDEFIQGLYQDSIPPADPNGCRNQVVPWPILDLALTLGLSPTVKTNTLLWVPVDLNHALTSDDVRGVVIQVSSSEVMRLKPDCTQAAKLGNFVPNGALTNPSCTTDSWGYTLNLLPSMPAFSGTGTLFYLPFRTQGVAGEATLSFKQHQLVNGQVKWVAHQAISATTQILPPLITGTARLQGRDLGLLGGTVVTVSNGLTTYTTTTEATGVYTLPLLSSGKITFTHMGYVKRVVSFNSDPTPLNVCLWAGDFNGSNSVTFIDWLMLSQAVLPVNFLAYDLNADGVTDGLDLMWVANNLGRSDMTSTSCPTPQNRQAPQQVITPVPTQAALTLTVQAEHQVALQLMGVREPIAAIGTRLKLPVGMTITQVELQNGFVGGFLHWQQLDNMLYLVALTPEGHPMTQAGEVAVVMTANGDAQQISLEASNVTAMPKLTWQTYLPLIIR